MRMTAQIRLLCVFLITTVACDTGNQPLESPMVIPEGSPFEYPLHLWDRKVTGETVLHVHVTREGTVDSVAVFNGSGHPEFDSAAVKGARKLRFVPGKRGSRSVSMWTKLPVRFEQDSSKI